MGDFIRYWRPLAKTAARDCCTFANDWQWMFGVPIFVGFVSPVLPVTLAQDPIVGGMLAAGGAFVVTWAIAFFARLLRAPVALDVLKSAEIAALKGRLEPRIQTGRPFTQTDSDPTRPTPRVFVRLPVAALADATVRGCRVLLTMLSRQAAVGGEWEPIWEGSRYCTWSANGAEAVDLHAGAAQLANIASIRHTTNPARLRAAISTDDGALDQALSMTGMRYRFHLLISADDGVPPHQAEVSVDIRTPSSMAMSVE